MWTLRRPHRSLFLLEEKDEKNDEQKQLKPTVHQIGSGPDDPVVTKERAQERVEHVLVGQVLEPTGE